MITDSVIVDTNIIFSAFIPKSLKIRDILFNSKLTFYSPDYLVTEIYKHREKLLKSSGLSNQDYSFLYNVIISQINFIPPEFISNENRQKAYDLCKNIDVKDTPFIALAIEFDTVLWTGDKKLKDGLIKLGFNSFYKL